MTASGSPFDHVQWVSQADAEGCGIATLAMIVGDTYEAVKAHLDSTDHDANGKPRDWTTGGCTHYTLDRYLGSRGFYISRRYEAWGLPLEPFAEIHYASVQQPSNRGHFVCVLANGDVLDPLREGRYRLSDWQKVNQLVGIAPPLRSVQIDVLRAARRFVRAEGEGHDGLIEDAHFQLLRAVTNLVEAA